MTDLLPFQEEILGWALERERAAIFADCGLGKTPMQLRWAAEVYRLTGKPVLLLTPLAVGFQTEREAFKFQVDAATSRDGSLPAPVSITNYERLHHFDTEKLGGVVCDESSIIKSFDGTTRQAVTRFLHSHRYRLLCTATAAPNDYTELGTSSEALGELGHIDMLTRFFTNKRKTGAQGGRGGRFFRGDEWRFKGHAEIPFWRWVATWARALRRPSDLGYDDGAFLLPPLEVRRHFVEAREARPDRLFDLPAEGFHEEREEQRRTMAERCEKTAEVVADAEEAVVWCHLNDEGDLLERLCSDSIQVSGSDSPDVKEAKLEAFGRGEARVLVTKPKIGAWGLNWQHCHRVAYFPSHSYEQWYQAVRRCWRFGQRHPVTVDVIATEGSRNTLANLERKAEQADRMFAELVRQMRAATAVDIDPYDKRIEVPAWAF